MTQEKPTLITPQEINDGIHKQCEKEGCEKYNHICEFCIEHCPIPKFPGIHLHRNPEAKGIIEKRYSFNFTWPDLYKLLYGKLGNDKFQPTHDELLEEFFANSLEANNFEIYRVIASLDSKILIERMKKVKEARGKPKSVGRIKEAGSHD